jgi:diguanylate cyclase (GGDEF)-like protein/PAS domain S-box-containing protein
MLHILLASHSWNEVEDLTSRLRNAGHVVRSERVEDPEELETALEGQRWDLLLYLDGIETLEIGRVMEVLAAHRQEVPVLVVLRSFEVERVATALRAGVRRVLPWEPEDLLALAVQREAAVLGQARDLQSCRDSLQESELRCRQWLDNSRDAVAYVHEGIHIYTNPAYAKLFGFESAEDMQGTPIMELINPPHHAEFKKFLRRYNRSKKFPKMLEVEALRNHEQVFPTSIELTPASVDGERCTQVLIRDLSTEQSLQYSLESLNRLDPLTQVYNRQFLLQELVRLSNDATGNVGLVLVRLDNFTDIKNDLGMLGSDQVILQAADTLRGILGEDGWVGRLSEVSFLIIDRAAERGHAQQVAERIRAAVDERIFEVSGRSVMATCTAAVYPPGFPIDSVQAVVTRLSRTWKLAHDSGGNRVAVFKPPVREKTEDSGEGIVLRIKEALHNNRMVLTYQAIVGLRGEPGKNYEVFPCVFDEGEMHLDGAECMAAAKQAGLLRAIERWTVQQSISVLAQHRAEEKHTGLFVPISEASLLDDEFPTWLQQHLKAKQLDGSALTFQVTEQVARAYLKKLMDVVAQLHLLQCRIALRVGMGEDLGHLRQLDVDYYKLDRSLTANLAGDSERQERIAALTGELKEKDKWIVAESVENANTMALLWQYGVHYVQGGYLHPPSREMSYEFGNSDV